MTVEANFDGLVGPTHHYGGLGKGNLASLSNAGEISNPRAAALEGLAKMRRMLELGLVQGVIPPQQRPHVGALRQLGYSGSDDQVITKAAQSDLQLLSAVSSASSMWTANAATVSPSADTADGKVHFTPSNLAAHLHRAIEAESTAEALQRIFPDSAYFTHHPPVPSTAQTGDEGAANHSRLGGSHGAAGVELFVYGMQPGSAHHGRYVPRQGLTASQAVARAHGLDPQQVVMARQSRAALDGGVFHNDVIAVADRGVLMYHQLAFAEEHEVLAELKDKVGPALKAFRIDEEQLSLGDAVSSYLFNSQLVELPDGSRALIAPTEAADNESSARVIEDLTGSAFDEVIFMNLRQSMRNGGGPACLRLRVVLSPDELEAVHQPCLLDEAKITRLETWVRAHYRTSLSVADLADPSFLTEVRAALEELTQLLELPGLYSV